ncbi:tetratricopeptide repeat protein [Dactylosporangium aurantiacum]|uniref:Tetratricopeptide repeat protein n=1 Tax=Dactylosporangium aurantiacum TaxID=35754 RepID=A0A9Q9IJV3_9ACTN|nr:tetratricopeptide repeat protein [Dactylosporangium aurantiacum]MDG6110279.1 tetratricopeptide repeat protein [Dactylosporangium aurantiacum]UWZ54403.1 tetratricopeptide repeat protein [Dactylosporangium aurantiacum]
MDDLQGSAATVGTMPELASLLRDLRRRQSRRTGRPPLTYRQLAARTGWSHGIIGEYLAGRVLPPTDRFDVLVRLLGAAAAEQAALASARDRVEEQRAAEHTEQRPRDRSGVAPRQLPADLTTFAGRTWQLALLDRLTADRRPILVSGTAGVGKTALAVHWAHQAAGVFPDGQLFLDLRGFGPSSRDPVAPADALGVALGLLGVPPAGVPAEPEARAGMYRGLLHDKRMLIVLDNAATAEQVRPLLPGSGASLVLVTSRVHLPALVTDDGARPLTLDLLDAADARTLLAGRIGAARTDREPEAVDSIVAACARLPLALSVVAARAALHPDFSLAAIAAELSSAHGRLDALRSDDPKADVETVFSWSYQRLTAPTQRLFRLGGLHPSPELGLPAAAALSGLPVAEVRPLLAELVRAQLVIEPRPGRFSMHDLLCAYASGLADRVEPAAERAAARRRLIEHYTRAATSAAMTLNPSRHPAGVQDFDPPARPGPAGTGAAPARHDHAPADLPADEAAAAEWFAVHRRALIGALQLAVVCGLDRQAWRLAWAMADHLDRGGHWGDWIATQRAAVGAAERLGDTAALALAHRSLSGGYIRSGRHDEARRHLRVAFDLFVELADHAGAARCQHALGWLLETQDRFAEAVAHDERALDLFRLADDPVGQARALNSAGWHHARLGHHELALACCEEALELQRGLGDAAGVAATLDSLGYVHHRLGEHDQAIARYQDALLRYVEQGDRFNEADTSVRLGDTWAAAGRWDEARQAWLRAAETLELLAHPKAAEVRTRLDDLADARRKRTPPAMRAPVPATALPELPPPKPRRPAALRTSEPATT